MLDTAQTIRDAALNMLQKYPSEKIVYIRLDDVFKPSDKWTVWLMTALDKQPKDGQLSALQILWATAAQLVLNESVYQPMFYAMTRRRSDVNFLRVYRAYRVHSDPNPLELNQEVRVKIPNLLRWARMMEQKTIETKKLRYALWKAKRATRIHKTEGSGSTNFIHIHN